MSYNTRSYMATKDSSVHAIASATIRRLFRLGLPVIPVVLVSFLLERYHLLYNLQVHTAYGMLGRLSTCQV